MQARRGEAVTPGQHQAPDLLTRHNGDAGLATSHDGLVGRSQSVRVLDGHDRHSRDAAGECDHAFACRQHRLARRPGEVDAAVPGEPGLDRRVEATDDVVRRRQRPAPGLGRRQQPNQQWKDQGGQGHRPTVPSYRPARLPRRPDVDPT